MPDPLSAYSDATRTHPPLIRWLFVFCLLLPVGLSARMRLPVTPIRTAASSAESAHSENRPVGERPEMSDRTAPRRSSRSVPPPIGFAYYDADRLYDTIPALFYDDSDFTPQGRLRWTAERYARKIAHTAAVLDSMRMDIVALAGVETEAVVRDLVSACREDYCYIHRTFNTFDGLDIALLYHGDRFFPDRIEQGRGWLYVEGELAPLGSPPSADSDPRSRRIGILACNNARYAAEALADCRDNHPDVPILAAGRFRFDLAPRHGMRDLSAAAERSGRGNIRYRDGWRMRERILADSALRASGADAYLRRFLFDARSGTPLATYEKTVYRGGYGSLLPVYTYLEQNYLEH